MPPLPKRIQPHATRAAEQPQDPHGDPTREELLAEDVSGAVQRHGPQDQQCDGEDAGEGFGDGGRAQEFALLLGVFFRGEARGAGDVFEVCAGGGGDVRVVAAADHSH